MCRVRNWSIQWFSLHTRQKRRPWLHIRLCTRRDKNRICISRVEQIQWWRRRSYQRKRDLLHRARCFDSVRLVCAKNSRWFDTSGPFTHQPVNRGICLLHLGRASEREKQHTRRRRESERGSDRVLDSDGRLHKTAGLGEKRAKIPARSKWSKSQAESRRVSLGVADAGENGHQHK